MNERRIIVKSRIWSLYGVVAAIVLSASPVAPARAANINMGTVDCQPHLTTGQPLALAGVNGMYNLSQSQQADVVCSLPRSPLASGATVAGFYVDGDGAGTSCTVLSYDFTGAFLGSNFFFGSAAHYDTFLSLPAAQATFYAYTYLWCQIPPGGVLRGVTAIQ
jgi:hypothetical protein